MFQCLAQWWMFWVLGQCPYPVLLQSFLKTILNCNVVNLQCCISFNCTEEFQLYVYTYICICYCSLAKSSLTLFNPVDCSTPGLPEAFTISWSLSKFMYIELVMPSTISFSIALFSCFQSFLASRSFPMSQLSASGGQSIWTLASESTLPMNIQGWFPLGLTRLTSLLSKEFSRVFSSTTVGKHQFFIAQPSLWSNSHICMWLLERP